ncbi:DUF1684 domain-containing protein [Pseudenhygromyxa sp. WMMC2535]|uniref:DUF1684 domain-containing protein n=1 Tax=Pseudenhygromyxa sp. WMMC2535 TaxID=2712867 RepID=UPI001557AB76|nr:DUF1684 domain-containing protein [Pseudenhygromyxa sp. WMMC2535]NVB41915.1 DUF1684 domain-containing protein [Pseudenhygromyxa sp. WMMC2535]
MSRAIGLLACGLALLPGLGCGQTQTQTHSQTAGLSQPTPESGASTAALDPGQRQAAAAEFQRRYDAELRDDTSSVLTAVAAHYLDPGASLDLERDAETDAWRARDSAANSPDSPSPNTVHIEAATDSLSLILGGQTQTITEHVEIALPAPEGEAQVGDDPRWRVELGRQGDQWRVLIHDRDAPRRRDFVGVDWFPIDPQLAVTARVEHVQDRSPRVLQTSRGETKTLYAAVILRFELPDHPGELALTAFAFAAEATGPGEPLLLPFTDATTGRQSYAAGRYIELLTPAGQTTLLDFNRATNPLCAYSEHYNCPFPPRFNALAIPVLAGARAPAH